MMFPIILVAYLSKNPDSILAHVLAGEYKSTKGVKHARDHSDDFPSDTVSSASTSTGKQKKQKKSKKVVDPNAPKKPLNGYTIFSVDKMNELKGAYPSKGMLAQVGTYTLQLDFNKRTFTQSVAHSIYFFTTYYKLTITISFWLII